MLWKGERSGRISRTKCAGPGRNTSDRWDGNWRTAVVIFKRNSTQLWLADNSSTDGPTNQPKPCTTKPSNACGISKPESPNCGGTFDIDARKAKLEELEQAQSSETFWANPEEARQLIAHANRLKAWVSPWRELAATAEELREWADVLALEEDEEIEAQWASDVGSAAAGVTSLELRTMLQGEDDQCGALLTVHPGAGGLESQDWAEMLVRMYTRWAERRGCTLKVLDLQQGEEAGIKSAALEIEGDHAYGYLKAENGVHRLVRISPFDSQSRRHTSFASVFVYPMIDDEIEVDIDETDLRVDTFRASGAGGQHVNKTDSAIRITHLPTGIVVSCQQERSQHKNRSTAMKMLRAALHRRAVEEREREREAVEATKSENAWANQIRSYVFQPYTMVNDHRTSVKVGDVQKVMDGQIDPFIEAYLKQFGAVGVG